MGEKIIVGPINQGLVNDRRPFVIDNDSFPVLLNAYQWRGRVKRKRGTQLLGRLKRYFDSTNSSYTSTVTITLDGSGRGNILTGFSLETNGNIVPGSVTLTASGGPTVYTDPTQDGYLTPTGTSGPNTINYASGAILIPIQAGNTVSAVFNYYPDLPVMGLEDFVSTSAQFPGTLGFDTRYSYNINSAYPYDIYDVSFYKNPPTGTYVGYTQKTNITPTRWNGEDYQQFWTVNYQNALWATNGINVPFAITNIGMQYKPIVAVTITAGGPPAIVNLQITGHGLVVGDFLFINEVLTTTGINFQTGYVTAVVDANNVTVEFPNATITTNGTGGIAQYLTNRADTTKDCLRWYDGDPTNGNVSTPTLNGRLGWVNFCPPLSQSNFSIADLPAAKYYLVGARVIVPYKDRLLFFGPVVQTSAAGSQVYLRDTVIYSQNGTPYYTCSYTNSPSATADTPTSATNVFNPILLPTNQTATPSAFFEDQTGFGGFLPAGVDQDIITVSPNEDALIVGFTRLETRLVYTGNDLLPFNFYIVNAELGSTSTFSTINMDEGILTSGTRGLIITSQVESRRIDLSIPDEAFEIKLTQNGSERFTAARDYINEWVYFSYPVNNINYKFPTQTLQYNYRDDSWGIFRECYTTYGAFRKLSGFIWSTVGNTFPTWSSWTQPWNAGASTLLQPDVIGGNQQGFILLRDEGTNEGNSLYIKNISFPATITGATQANPCVLTANNQFVVGQTVRITGVVGMTELNNNSYSVTAATATTVTISADSTLFGAYISGGTITPLEPIYSPDHCLNEGDYIVISGAIGTIGASVNNKIFKVALSYTNGFSLNPPLSTTGTYFGRGVIKRMYLPFIQTKQFPTAWAMGRKTRLGPQQYLFTTTANSQITLLIYLSQAADFAFNSGAIVPTVGSSNNSLVYSTILYTCPESTNLGLTPANINLNMVTAQFQDETWHRMNTSLIGDTVQVGFTLSDSQMRDINMIYQFAEIELHGFILDVTPSQLLA